MSEVTAYTMYCDGDLQGYWVRIFDTAAPISQFWFVSRTIALHWIATKGKEMFGEMVRVENVQERASA